MTYINYNCGDGQLQVHATYSDINQRMYDTKEKNRTVKKGDDRFQYVAVPYESMLDLVWADSKNEVFFFKKAFRISFLCTFTTSNLKDK